MEISHVRVDAVVEFHQCAIGFPIACAIAGFSILGAHRRLVMVFGWLMKKVKFHFC